MPWRQIERFPCRCHAFVCAATFALDLIKSKHTRTHSYTPHSHTEWWNWQKFVWIRERQRTWKSGREKESLDGEGKDLELQVMIFFFSSHQKQNRSSIGVTRHQHYPGTVPIFGGQSNKYPSFIVLVKSNVIQKERSSSRAAGCASVMWCLFWQIEFAASYHFILRLPLQISLCGQAVFAISKSIYLFFFSILALLN